MAVKPLCEKFHELGKDFLLFFFIINVYKFELAHFIAEEIMLCTLPYQLRVANLHHVFFLMCKMCLCVLIQLLDNTFQFLVIVAVVVSARKNISLGEKREKISVLVVYGIYTRDAVIRKFKCHVVIILSYLI